MTTGPADDVDLPSQADTSWLSALHDLRVRAGNPSTHSLAFKAGMGDSTVQDILAGRRFPSLASLLRLARVLDGDREQFIKLWQLGRGAPVPQLLQAQLEELRAIRALLECLSAGTPGRPHQSSPGLGSSSVRAPRRRGGKRQEGA